MPAPDYLQQAFDPASYFYRWEDGSTQSGSYGNQLVYQNFQDITSNKTPNWGSLSKQAKTLTIQNYEKVWSTWRDPIQVLTVDGTFIGPPWNGLHCKLTYRTTFWQSQGAWLSDPGWRSEDVASIAVNALLAEINVIKTNSLVSLAEIHKTAGLVAQTATKIASALKALRRLDLGGMANAIGLTVTTKQIIEFDKRKFRVHQAMFDRYSDYASTTGDRRYLPSSRKMARYGHRVELQNFMQSTWLEYRYGWRPLLSDVYSTSKALAQQLVQRQNVVRQAKGRAKAKEQYQTSYINPSNPLYTSKYFREEERFCEYQVFYRVDESVLNALNTFGILNPLAVAWELVPFSFVADWFIPVGNYLENLTATVGLTFATARKTTKTRKSRSNAFYGNGSTFSTGGRVLIASGGFEARQEDFTMKRERLSSFPSASTPRWKNPLKTDSYVARATDAIALLSSLFLTRGGISTLRT